MSCSCLNDCSPFLQFYLHSKILEIVFTFIKRIVSRRNFKATLLVVYLVGVNKILKDFNNIIVYNAHRFALNIPNFKVKIGHKMSYWCTKFEGFIHEMIIFGQLNIIFKNSAKKKNVNKIMQFIRNIRISCELLSQFSSNLVCKVMYMEGIKHVNLIEINPVIIEIQGVEMATQQFLQISHLCAALLPWPLTRDHVS